LAFLPLSKVNDNDPLLASPPNDVENRLVVRQVLARIPVEQRVCLVLHFVEGFKYREIAEIVGISRDAVCKRVARGSKRFQTLYAEVNDDEVL
jgi:RNA polymerase sigma-70 factor (ECF subfamily)